MKIISTHFNYLKQIDFLDRFIFVLISLIPLSLALSIFVADFFASIVSILLLVTYFKDKKSLNEYFFKIKFEIIFFLIFFFIIIISFLINENKTNSFLPSIFYFRYFLLSLSIYYIFNKYDFIISRFLNYLLISLILVIFDAFIQLIFGINLLGYESTSDKGPYVFITGFFDDEKKLGSFLIRIIPLLFSLIYLMNIKKNINLEIFLILSLTIIIFFTSERVALFLFLVFILTYLILSNSKILFSSLIVIFLIILFSLNESLRKKYINYTIMQTGIIFLDKTNKNAEVKKEAKNMFKNDLFRYYSHEHENLSYTGLMIFKDNYLLGTSIKSFYNECHKYKVKYGEKKNDRNNKLLCSTHPHNTYVQILTELGIFAFIIVFFVFGKTLSIVLKEVFGKKKVNQKKAIIFANLSILLNLMPLIPSGSFFNNWLSIILYFSLGYTLYVNYKFK